MSKQAISHTKFSRRAFVQLGGLGLCGLTLPELLAAKSSNEKSCIFIILSGGPSQLDTFDPKPLAPSEIRGPYQTIPTKTPGVFLSEMFPRLSQSSDKYCLVRSLSHGDGVHVTAAHTMLSGQPDGSRRNDSPFLGSLISYFKPSQTIMPSHVWLHNMKTGTHKIPRYNSGLSKVGMGHAPVQIGYELDNPASPNFRVSEFDPPEGVSKSQFQNRFQLLNQLEAARTIPDATALERYQSFQERAKRLVAGPDARSAFDLNQEQPATRDRYGRHPLGQYTLMARRLIEAGVRLVTVTAWPGLAPGETQPTVTQVWDTHGTRYKNGDSMYGNGPFGMKWSLPRLDQSVSALLEDLSERGMLQDTLVVMLGEFGRTPKFENEGKGRGHWPACYTGLVAGGGVQGGSVYGASDSQAAYVAKGRPISHADFGATMLHALGIPAETRYGPDGFSYRASDGHPVVELFS